MSEWHDCAMPFVYEGKVLYIGQWSMSVLYVCQRKTWPLSSGSQFLRNDVS